MGEILDLLAVKLARDLQRRGYDAPMDRLSGGRTNRVWRLGEYVAKLYVPRDENPLFPNLPYAEWSCLGELAPLGLAPEPVEHFESVLGEVVIYRHVAGTIWRGDTAPVAEMLDRLHRQSPALPGLRNLPNGGASVMAHGQRILDMCGDRTMLEKLKPETPDVGPVASILVHTDVTRANIIATESGPMLIDWQCPGLGDPVEDLAVFLSPAMSIVYGDGLLSQQEQNAFLAGFTNRELPARYTQLAPAYHWRMAAYCQWRLESGVAEYEAARDAEITTLKTYL